MEEREQHSMQWVIYSDQWPTQIMTHDIGADYMVAKSKSVQVAPQTVNPEEKFTPQFDQENNRSYNS